MWLIFIAQIPPSEYSLCKRYKNDALHSAVSAVDGARGCKEKVSDHELEVLAGVG